MLLSALQLSENADVDFTREIFSLGKSSCTLTIQQQASCAATTGWAAAVPGLSIQPVWRFKTTTCNFCKRTGHLEVGRLKNTQRSDAQFVKCICWREIPAVSNSDARLSKLEVPVYINDKSWVMELDTVTGGQSVTTEVCKYQSANKYTFPIVGTFTKQHAVLREHRLKWPFLISKFQIWIC